MHGTINIGAERQREKRAVSRHLKKSITRLAKALEKELLSVDTESMLSSWRSIWLGSPHFYQPRWWQVPERFPWNWTSFYDTEPARSLLMKYVDFGALRKSPIRLLVSTVNVETAEIEVFDSRADEITVDHILASGSLPAAFPWTTIHGKHYWDAGIISNSPLELVVERCGEANRRAFVVDLFVRHQPLPENLAEVLMRRDEIVYAERVRSDVKVREHISDFRSLVQEIMENVEPEACQRLRQNPRFVQLMADMPPTTITRIVNEVPAGEQPFREIDFSASSIARHKDAGYQVARRILGNSSSIPREVRVADATQSHATGGKG